MDALSNSCEFQRRKGYGIVFLDPKTLHEKNLDIQIQYGSTITTTFIESLVLLDGATELYG